MSTAFPDETGTASRKTLSGLGKSNVPNRSIAKERGWVLDADDDSQDPVLRLIAVTSADRSLASRRRGAEHVPAARSDEEGARVEPREGDCRRTG